MGDLINNSETFKKLGFDTSNQWIFYDDRFQPFFNFLAENITDDNICTEHEVLEHNELVQRGEWLDDIERSVKLRQLESENPGLLKYTEMQANALCNNIMRLEQTCVDYESLIEDMRNTKHSINGELSQLEHNISSLHNTEKELMTECQKKAKQLEELQNENYKLSIETKKLFTKIQSPPFFFHQLSLDQYLLKHDSFMQFFTLYMKEIFKIEEFIDYEPNDDETNEIVANLNSLQNSIKTYTMAYIKEKTKAKATQALIDQLDLSQVHCISLADMTRETHELEMVNEHHLKITYETLIDHLGRYVQQHTEQRIELVLYENTKQKLERAMKRREIDKRLTEVISDSLSNAELVWIAIQLDLEKTRNRCDSTEQLHAMAQASWQRVQTMRSLNSSYEGTCAQFLHEIAAQLSAHLTQSVRTEAKACLFEYEKFCRLLSYALQTLLNKKLYTPTLEQLNELKRLELVLKPFVYDSPVQKPMFEHVRYLRPIFNAKLQQQNIEKNFRNLRIQFHEQITERMDKDKFWRFSQLLWIWFLTEPKRMIQAIDEVKKASSKMPSIAVIKSLGGLKRK